MSFPDFRTRRLGLTTAAAAIAFAVAGTAAAQSMVVRSTGPSASKYPTGAKLKASDKLTLVAGDKIVLMQGGKTRTLSEPGTYGASGPIQSNQTMGSAVTRMLASGPSMRSRGGFSRGPDEPKPAELRAPNLWFIDYREAGTFCVAVPSRTKENSLPTPTSERTSARAPCSSRIRCTIPSPRPVPPASSGSPRCAR